MIFEIFAIIVVSLICFAIYNVMNDFGILDQMKQQRRKNLRNKRIRLSKKKRNKKVSFKSNKLKEYKKQLERKLDEARRKGIRENLKYNMISKRREAQIKEIASKALNTFNNSYMSRIENRNFYYSNFKFSVNHLGIGVNGQAQGRRITIDPDHINFDTIAHELGHAIDYCIRGFSCHDEYWGRICKCMGLHENYVSKHAGEMPFDDLSGEWEYMSDGKNVYFINILTGQRVYKHDNLSLFNNLMKEMV